MLSEEDDPNVQKYLDGSWEKENKRHPVDLELELVLGKMPRKVRIPISALFCTESKFIIFFLDLQFRNFYAQARKINPAKKSNCERCFR